ncbi:WYL domain-containing protein [Flavobacterium sp.]|jgi:hypothetical protein|uniref:WYL domain-containing protein n=1 Tax=Flavobacterium sp. TaxID=239 RepID=UPI0037BEA378
MRQNRIEFICEKIKEEATINEIEKFLLKKFSRYEDFEFKKPTFEKDLTDIRRGNFDYSNSLKRDKKNKELFLVKLNRSSGKYYFDEKSPIPEFSSKVDRELMTLPFLLGVLNQYKSLPIVKKVIDDLYKTYFIDEDELKSIKAVITTKPSLINEEKIVELVIKILGNIKRNECIEFNYINVHNLDERLIKSLNHKVIPLQIRLHENLYYLIGYNKELEKISNYRLDQIIGLKVDTIEDELTEKIEYFEDNFVSELNLDAYFYNTIGVWCHGKDNLIETVEITFFDWAASYVRRLPIHATQVIKNIDVVNNKLTIEINIKLFPYKSNENKKARDRSPELAFLLGRFRQFCEINEEKLIEKYKINNNN